MLSKDLIEVKDNVATLKGITSANEVAMLLDYAKENNVEKYVAITADGKRYHILNNAAKPLKPDEIGYNPFYKAPEKVIEEEKTSNLPVDYIEEIELIKKQLIDKEDIIKTLNEKIEEYNNANNIMLEGNADLQNKLDELSSELKESNSKIEFLSKELEEAHESLEKKRGLTLDEVVEYVRNNGYQLIIE